MSDEEKFIKEEEKIKEIEIYLQDLLEQGKKPENLKEEFLKSLNAKEIASGCYSVVIDNKEIWIYEEEIDELEGCPVSPEHYQWAINIGYYIELCLLRAIEIQRFFEKEHKVKFPLTKIFDAMVDIVLVQLSEQVRQISMLPLPEPKNKKKEQSYIG